MAYNNKSKNKKKSEKKSLSEVNEFIEQAEKRFKYCQEFEQDDREKSIKDQKSENGDQWSEQDIVERGNRPSLTFNKQQAAVKQLVGDSRQNRPAIKVRAAKEGASREVAKILSGLIRNIENLSDAETIYDYGVSCSGRSGWGAWRVITQYADELSFDQEILIKRIVDPHSVYFDPKATEPDKSDANYCFVTEEILEEEFKEQYPDANITSWSDDVKKTWINGRNVIVAEYFYKCDGEPKTICLFDNGKVYDKADLEDLPKDDEGRVYIEEEVEGSLPMRSFVERERVVKTKKVKWCKLSGTDILEEGAWAGKYIPIVECMGEEVWISGEGKRERRSCIRFSHDAQKLYNYSRSTSAETMSLGPKQPWLVTDKQIEGYEREWDTANTVPKSRLTYKHIDGHPRPQRQQGSFPDIGAIQEAQLASDDIKATTNIYDPSLGKFGNEKSGKALQEVKMQGSTAQFEFHDNQAKAIKYTGRIIVDLIPKIYDTERIERIIGEDGREEMVTINKMTGDLDENQNNIIENDLTVGKYDVVVDVGPGFATKRQEAADGMLKVLEIYPMSAPVLVPKIAKNSDWPESESVSEELDKIAQGSGQPSPKEELDIQGKQLSNQKKQIDIQKATTDMQQMAAQVAQATVLQTLQQLGLVR